MLEINNFIDEILTPLPYRPYCSDDLADGLRIRPLQTAKNRRYLQINPPTQQHYLVFDVDRQGAALDRKSTRLNSSHVAISYAVFCLKKKKDGKNQHSRDKDHTTSE